jgi:hypothetical protein
MVDQSRKFVVTLYNERNESMRAQEQGAWHEMFRKGTIAITGFGYYAERAEVAGFTYYNTSLNRQLFNTVGTRSSARRVKNLRRATSSLASRN